MKNEQTPVVDQKIYDKNAELKLDETLQKVSKDWYESKSIKNKWRRFVVLRNKLAQAQQEVEKNEKEKIDDIYRKHIKSFDPREPISLLDIRGHLAKWKYQRNIQKAMLVNMELTNGDHTSFIAYPISEKFEFEQGMYIVDHNAKYYHHQSKMFASDYHQDIAMPIIRKIPVEKIRSTLAQTGITDIENSINPRTVKQWFESDIILKIMKGAEMGDVMNLLKILMFINLAIGGIHLLLFINKSGMLSGVKLW